MISGTLDRRRRALFWSTLASATIHLIVLTLLFYEVTRLFTPRGAKEVVSQTNVITVQKRAVPTPTPAPAHAARPVHQQESAPARTRSIPHELAKQVTVPASPQPRLQRPTVLSKVSRDEAGFAKEVAQLNKQNDPRAIPTIDPGSRRAASKSYAFTPPSQSGDEGNGIITPVQSWHEGGRDCYYGRYEFTYPDGAMESGSIVWPFCYDPDSDPFKEPPHPMPFPLPLPGYRLPADTQLPPIEKTVYEEWAAAAGDTAAPRSTP